MGKAQSLSSHPNFQPPPPPSQETIEEIVRYTLEYAARLISPPKVDGEDEEIECDDVAAELRNSVQDIIDSMKKK